MPPMSTSAPQPEPNAAPAPSRRGAGRIALLVSGCILALLALGLLAGGVGAVVIDLTQRDDDGYFTTPTERFTTSTAALTHEGVDIGDASEAPGWIVDQIGAVRVVATPDDGRPLFVGIGPSDAVARYLDGVAHDEVTHVEFDPFRYRTRAVEGGRSATPPAEQTFWVASSTGPGPQAMSWDVRGGEWSLVVMRASGAPGIAADVQLGADADWVLWVGLVLIAASLLVGAGAVALIVAGAHGATAGPVTADVVADAAEAPYPVRLDAALDPTLSRGLWLIKWLLALPHVVLLVFLWAAFAVVTIVAFFAILITGRYPQRLFAFNVGVLRWTWRVGWYAFAGLGTDRYPPFSLAAEPDYPATLDVPYPERLSRGRVLVKSWLLAIPHLIVVGVFLGGSWSTPAGSVVAWPGLIGALTLFAVVALLFSGRYPRDLYRLVVGLCRWTARVCAYVALMRDEYPPFRLDP
jgi:hypothetical protein